MYVFLRRHYTGDRKWKKVQLIMYVVVSTVESGLRTPSSGSDMANETITKVFVFQKYSKF